MKRATILTTNENSEKRGQIQNISQQKINTKTPKNAYNLNVGKIVGLNVGKRKLQKAPTNTDYRITKKQYQNSLPIEQSKDALLVKASMTAPPAVNTQP